MALQNLTCDTLGELHHGFARQIINAALEAAQRDADDRGADEKPRTVTITISFAKIDDSTVKIGLKAKAGIPEYQIPDTVATIAAPAKKGASPQFAFREDSPTRPDQQTIDDARE